MFKVTSRNTRRRFGIFINNFEYIWHIVLVLLFFFFIADFKYVNAEWNTWLP